MWVCVGCLQVLEMNFPDIEGIHINGRSRVYVYLQLGHYRTKTKTNALQLWLLEALNTIIPEHGVSHTAGLTNTLYTHE